MTFIRLLTLTVLLTVPFTVLSDFKNIFSLARKGDAIAQYNIGTMYDKGEGVTQSYTEALKWYRLAAEQNNANA